MLYIPIHPTCVKGTFSEVAREPHPTGDLYYYGNPRWTGWQSAGRLPHPKSPDHDGHLVAMDIETGEVRWRHSTRTRSLAAALTTAGGLVVTADGDRYLYVMDVETGDVLFRTRLPAPVQGFPITYAVDDRQYLAIPVGGGRMPGAPNAMYVFALPEHDSVP
jgi:alcohol dehydrogenase (cytochrome c)